MSLARLTCALVRSPTAGIPALSTDGLWRLYDGGPLPVMVPGLAGDAPVIVYCDIATATWAQRTPALHDHDDRQPVGWWQLAASDGRAIDAGLTLLRMERDGIISEHHWQAEVLRALVADGMPLECSIGAEPGAGGAYELLTEPAVINGRSVDPAAHQSPVYVLRGAVIREASIVTLGAAQHTGRLAARLAATINPHKESAMPTLAERRASLTEAHGAEHAVLIAERLIEGDTDEQITERLVQLQAEQAAAAAQAIEAERAELAQALEAATARVAQLESERDAAQALVAEHAATIGQLKAGRGTLPPPTSDSTQQAPQRRSTMSLAAKQAFITANGHAAYCALPY